MTHKPPQSAAEPRLTDRELAILQLAARGLRNRQIAASLEISVRTAEGHLARISAKLGVTSRTQAVLAGAARGWCEFDEQRGRNGERAAGGHEAAPRPPKLSSISADSPARRARVLIADDHAAVRHALRTVLDAREDLEVIGDCADGAAAVSAAKVLQPDIVLMDLQMPVLGGIEATRGVRAGAPGARVIILTASGDRQALLDAITAGATGFVLKQAGIGELVRAIDQVRAGKTYSPREFECA